MYSESRNTAHKQHTLCAPPLIQKSELDIRLHIFISPGYKGETSMAALVDTVVVVNAPCSTQNMSKNSRNSQVHV